MKKYLTINEKKFYCNLSFDYSREILTINIPDKRLLTYRVDKKSTYYCKALKTKISAQGGVDALYKTFKECIDNNFGIEMFVILPLKNIIETTKTLKI